MSLVFGNVDITGLAGGSGLSSRKSVRAATTANGTFTTAFADGQTIDGVLLATNDRILIKNQTTGLQNGVYMVQATGVPIRETDFDTEDHVGGSYILVQEGTKNQDTGWLCTNNDGSDLPDTDVLAFKLITGDVSGDGSSTDNAIVRWNGTDGITVQSSSILIDDSNNMTGLQYLEFSDISAPTNPSAGQGRLYKKVGDDGIFWKPDAAGPEVDLTTVTNLPTTTKGDLIVHNGVTDVRLPVGTNDQILVANSGATEGVSWTTIAGSRTAYVFTTNQVEAAATTYETLTYLTWDDSRYSNYSNGTVIFEAVIADRTLDIRLQDTTNAVTLGSLTTINASGFYTFAVSNPSADARMEIQVLKSAVGGTSPEVYGLTLEYVHPGTIGNTDALGEANTASNVGIGGIGVFKQKAGVDLEFKNINSTTASSGIIIVDDAGNSEIDINLSINSLTEELTPNATADFVLMYDTSTATHKKILIDTLPSAGAAEYLRTEVNTATYTILDSDDIISVLYTTTGAVTLTLPQISTIGGSNKKRYTIVDEGGNAGNNTITIVTSGGDTIIGQASFDIIGNYNSISVYNNTTTGWFIA